MTPFRFAATAGMTFTVMCFLGFLFAGRLGDAFLVLVLNAAVIGVLSLIDPDH